MKTNNKVRDLITSFRLTLGGGNRDRNLVSKWRLWKGDRERGRKGGREKDA